MPSALVEGGGMAFVGSGNGSLSLLFLEEVLLWRFRIREEESFVAASKLMKKGVYSPSKGAALPSVMLPRKIWSSKVGGAGEGAYELLLNALRTRRSLLRMKLPAETGLTMCPYDLRFISEAFVAVAFEVAFVPFWNMISTLKFGWSGALGEIPCCSSFGTAQLHMVDGSTQSESANMLLGCTIVETPVGIGGNPVRLSHWD